MEGITLLQLKGRPADERQTARNEPAGRLLRRDASRKTASCSTCIIMKIFRFPRSRSTRESPAQGVRDAAKRAEPCVAGDGGPPRSGQPLRRYGKRAEALAREVGRLRSLNAENCTAARRRRSPPVHGACCSPSLGRRLNMAFEGLTEKNFIRIQRACAAGPAD